MQHWTTDFYRCVDSADPGVAAYFAPDVRTQVGNHPPGLGLAAMFDGPIGRNVAAVRGSTHEFTNIWDVDVDTAVLESWVTYHRRDGLDVKVPAVTVLHRNSNRLIDDLRLYIDTTPLFAGWSPEAVA